MVELSSQYKVEEPFVQQNDHFDDKGVMTKNSLCGKKFSEAFDAYKAKILRQHVENPQDLAMNKAMMAITIT